MKKTIFAIILSTLLFGYTSAQNTDAGQSNNANSANSCENCVQNQNTTSTQSQYQTSNQGETNQLSNTYQTKIELNEQERSQLENQVESQAQIQNQLLQEEASEAPKKIQATLQNQVQAKTALEALNQVANTLQAQGGGLSPYVQQLTNTFNECFNIQQKLAERSGFAQFFIGTDQKSVQALQAQTQTMANQIEELQSQTTQFDSQTQIFIDQYITELLSEYDNLVTQVQSQEKNRGIFYWMFGWLWGYK